MYLFCQFQLVSADERSSIETASVNFFRSVISCHIPNQMLFAKVLYDVVKEQGVTNKAGMKHLHVYGHPSACCP